MWTLQRPNKGPDKKWRLNKESKYSSLLRPKKKEDMKLPDTPSPPFYRPLNGPPPDPRMMNPRLPGTRPLVPRMDPNYAPLRPPLRPGFGPRSIDQHMSLQMDPTESKLIEERMGPRSLENRPHESRAHDRTIYTRPIDSKTNKMESNSSESEDELYRRIRSRPGWVGPRKRDSSADPRPERIVREQKTHHSEMDLRIKPLQELRAKPLQELNGREKHVERFLASLQDNADPAPSMEVVSRQRILSRSRDDLINNEYEDEDIWDNLDILVKEHVHEILKKWEQIDDGIWAKAIVFEKNRRVAKAYVRPPILTVNGSDVGFDGHRIGLRGFDNPMRDAKTLDVISRCIGQGVKIRMDNKGNIEVKKLSHYHVYAKPLGEENAISDEICKTPNMSLDSEKQMVFDIRKFEQNVNREVRKAYPDIAKLENQCIMALAFAKPTNVLACPSWVMIINIVAMDMLRSRLPLGLYVKVPNIKNRPRLPVPEEDPYSLTGAGSGTSSGGSSGKEKGKDKPPKLPPRDNTSNKTSSKGDYDSPDDSVFRRYLPRKNNNNNNNTNSKEKPADDPYYCGLRARIPNFAKQSKSKDKMDLARQQQYHPHAQVANPTIFHSRSVDSGMAYMQQTHAPYIYKFDRNHCSMVPPQPVGYVSEWENYWVS